MPLVCKFALQRQVVSHRYVYTNSKAASNNELMTQDAYLTTLTSKKHSRCHMRQLAKDMNGMTG